MNTASHAPADTRMMGIVHRALGRDLARARVALTSTPSPADAQRKALGDHLQWMMRFLHHHHVSEDVGLYPMIRERNGSVSELLDVMEVEHQAIGPGLTAIRETAAAYESDTDAASVSQVIASIDLLEAALIPHLQHEEQDLMPIVGSTLTNAEWLAWDQQYNIKPKSVSQLGFTAHWLIDDVSDDDRNVVLSLMPVIPRFILMHGFAGPYRRHKARCWGVQAQI